MADLFVIDSNILISCHRQTYPFDIAPLFWQQLVEKSLNKVVLLDRVKKEIYRNQDHLSDWLKKHENCFLNHSIASFDVGRCYTEIISSVNDSKLYKESAKEEFASVADSWICAYAMATKNIVVTNEKFERNNKKKVKIPNICHQFGITCFDLLQFIRALGIKLA